MNTEWIHRLFLGERGGTILWKIPLGEIEYEPISDPAEGVSVATLAENILQVGLLQPILLWKMESAQNGTSYRLIAGRRRLEALRMLGKTHVSAIVVSCKEEELPLLALSDNGLHRDTDAFDVADKLAALICRGYTVARLSRLLGMPTVTLERLLSIRSLSDEHRRLLKLCGASGENVLALMQIPDELHEAVLHRAASDPSVSIAWLAEEYVSDPTAFALQFHKIWTADLKLFVNTLHRSIRTMENAGFLCEVLHQEKENEVAFTIRLRKPMTSTPAKSVAVAIPNVSRETFMHNAVDLSILDTENSLSGDVSEAANSTGNQNDRVCNVSRETLHRNEYKNKRNRKENVEKLKNCIDESSKR